MKLDTVFCCQYDSQVRWINCGQDLDRLTSGHQCWWYLYIQKKKKNGYYWTGHLKFNTRHETRHLLDSHLFLFEWALIESSVKNAGYILSVINSL